MQTNSEQSVLAKITQNKKLLITGLCLILLLIWRFFPSQNNGQERAMPPQPVRVMPARLENMPVYLSGLGTVTPINTVTVKSRVDGELVEVHFEEGQNVKTGDLLAVIDPRPYETKLLQAKGALERDTALLDNAKRDLVRYQKLFKEGSVPLQQLQNQESLVAQYTGTLQIDKANVADAELSLSYTRLVAPIDGRIGFKQVDVGNFIRSADAKGLVVITQLDPIQVVFSIVGKHIPQIMEAKGATNQVTVEIFDQTNTKLLSSGVLDSVDNQIDTATGTVKLKALLQNTDHALYPNQFVNARLLVQTLENALVIPSSALLQGNDGFYVYIAEKTDTPEGMDANKGKPQEKTAGPQDEAGKGKPDAAQENTKHADDKAPPSIGTARVQKVKAGLRTDDTVVIIDGLQAGDLVVTDGTDRLREGSKIRFRAPAQEQAAN